MAFSMPGKNKVRESGKFSMPKNVVQRTTLRPQITSNLPPKNHDSALWKSPIPL
jgi:hypothetical protein